MSHSCLVKGLRPEIKLNYTQKSLCFPTTVLCEGKKYNFTQKDKNRNMEIHTNLWAKDEKFDTRKTSSMCESLMKYSDNHRKAKFEFDGFLVRT